MFGRGEPRINGPAGEPLPRAWTERARSEQALARGGEPRDRARAVAWTVSAHVHLYDLADLSSTGRLGPHGTPPKALAFSSDGRRLLSGSGSAVLAGASSRSLEERSSRDEAVRAWSVEEGRLLWRVEQPALVQAVLYSPGGETALVGTSGGRILLLDPETGARQNELHGEGARLSPWDASPPAHSGGVRSMGFARGGRRLITTSGSGGATADERELRLWDTETLVELGRRQRLSHKPDVLEVAPGGERYVLGAFKSGELEVWGLPP